MTKWIKLFLLISPFHSFGGLIHLYGHYNGKNIFIENNIVENSNVRCVTNVYVNNKHLADHPTNNIVEINLSTFAIGDSLDIRIYHKSTCLPKLINPKDIEDKGKHFEFVLIEINEEKIHWKTKGEDPIGKFVVEQLVNGSWEIVSTNKADGSFAINSYFQNLKNLSGTNKYRINYKSTDGKNYTSPENSYVSSKSPVIFYPKRVVDYITFDSEDHRDIPYKIIAEDGTKLLEGKSIVVDCRNLPLNVFYILQYENREERFFKKAKTGEELNTEIK